MSNRGRQPKGGRYTPPRRPTPEAMAAYDANLQRIVDEVGWAIQGVGAGEDFPQFAYTVGLSKWNHPEVVMVGLAFETMKHILNNVGFRVRDGQRFEPGQRYTEIIGSTTETELTVGFRTCSNYDLNFAKAMFGRDIPALQLLWPDTQNHLPGEPDFEARFAEVQPLWP